ncbi:glycosyltransferase [Nakamurella sp. GG22]
MRIALVSAHYPPNFVSGGTLVPQRIAEGLARRGHRVSVFAGSMDDGHRDLTVRQELTAGGVAIQWTTITGMLAWTDQVNYANDEIEAEFARWLARTRPRVVHFHNLQGFGGALVSLASAAGAVVVVTMHDMWWWCARQFLVTRNLRPCSTVVDCGVCPCERTNTWLVERNQRLASHLQNADLVLAPSSTMIDLLSANGVDPQRLALDENPSPDAVRAAVSREPGDGTVRFVFAGGKHAVKGAGVAVEAARSLDALDGWSLDLYGDEETDLPEHVRSLPPYPADEVARVLSRYDVLLMSSVMLESYSLLTREALAAGCAVITGDNPGPTEVVKDGVNGLVVPRGDPEAFGDAMRRLVTEPGLLASLQPTPGELPLRSLEDQLDGLEQRYADLVAARRSAPAMTVVDRELRPIRRVLIASGITGAPLRYRGHLPREALSTVGVQADVHMYRDVQVFHDAREADAVVLYRVPATQQILDLIEMIRRRPDPVPILFDVDDLIFDPGLRTELDPMLEKVAGLDLELYWQGIRRYRTTLEAADAYIGSTDMLCDQVSRLTGIPVHRWSNGVSRETARISDRELHRKRRAGPVRIGYLSGTNTHNEDWAFVEPAIREVLRSRPDVQLWIGGLLEPSPALAEFSGRIRRLPLKPWSQLPAVLRDLDINLAPLEPGKVFNEAKSSIKWLEAALTRTPTVASPSQPFRESIEHGSSGMLAAGLDDWTRLLLELIDDAPLRHRIGYTAREQALLTLSPAQQGHRYLEILESARRSVIENGHRPLFENWQPEVLSEAYILQVPDGYGAPQGIDRGGEARSLRRITRDYVDSGRNHLRTQGVAGTALKAATVAARVPAKVAGRLR